MCEMITSNRHEKTIRVQQTRPSAGVSDGRPRYRTSSHRTLKDYYRYVFQSWLFLFLAMTLLGNTESSARGMGDMGREHLAEMLEHQHENIGDMDSDLSTEDWEKLGSLSVEKRLISKLLDKYEKQGKMGRPVVHTNDKLTVYFGLSLIQIMDVDESNQILKSSMWYRYEWTDILLRWTPSLYENINSIRIPSSKIWLPDILLYNFADDRLNEQRDALVIVHSNGSIQWMPQAILRSSCSFDTKYFPFDVQRCYLKFGSWAYNGNKLNVEFVGETSFDLSDYVISNEWHIIENNATRNVKYYTCCPEPFPDITYSLTLKRKTAFYTFIIILPCTLLSLLTLVIFWVPPESPAKLQLGMSVFVAFFFLLLVLAGFVPRAAPSIPLIGAYFCLSMVMITVSTVLSCAVANMYFRGVRINRAPAWMRSCIGSRVARVFGLDSPKPMTFDERSRKMKFSNKTYGDNASSYELEKAHVRLFENGNHTPTLIPRQNQDPKHNLHNQPPPPHHHHHHHHPNQHHQQQKQQQQQQQQQQQHQEHTTNYDSDETTVDRDLNYELLPARGASYSALLQEVRAIRDVFQQSEVKKKRMEERNKLLQEWRILACITDRVFFLVYVVVNVITISVLFTAI